MFREGHIPDRIHNRNPQNNMAHSAGHPVYGPQYVLANSEVGTEWFRTGRIAPGPYFGGHDALEGRMMRVSQADTYDASPNPWPNNGQWDMPGAMHATREYLLRLNPTTSAHPGAQMPNTPGGPTMLFVTPPVFSYQTVPIRAVGV